MNEEKRNNRVLVGLKSANIATNAGLLNGGKKVNIRSFRMSVLGLHAKVHRTKYITQPGECKMNKLSMEEIFEVMMNYFNAVLKLLFFAKPTT